MLIFLFFTVQATAQFGFRAKHNLNYFNDLNEYFQQTINTEFSRVFESTVEFGLDYTFQTRKYRIDILHELFIGLNQENILGNTIGLEFSYLGYNLNTQIYILDLKRKSEDSGSTNSDSALREGFFLALVPGFMRSTTKGYTGLAIGTSAHQIHLRMGVGLGFDIPFGNLFTLTPAIHYHIIPRMEYDSLPIINGIDREDSNTIVQQIQFQLRFGF
ncbi:MAG: hypothetical protein AAGA77_09145 [Bacteroidota bacterium]